MKRIVFAVAVLFYALPAIAAPGDVDVNDSVRSIPNHMLDKPLAPINGITPPRAANPHTVSDYPAISRMNGEQGVVLLKFTVNLDGTVSNAQVVKSCGYPRLDQAAVDQVTANWRYVPAMKDGKPMVVALQAAVKWTLREDDQNPIQIVELTPADFPPGAYDKGETGHTDILILFDKSGQAQTVAMVQSSGYDDLDEAAQKIARSWHATPPAFNGKSIPFVVGVEAHWPAKK